MGDMIAMCIICGIVIRLTSFCNRQPIMPPPLPLTRLPLTPFEEYMLVDDKPAYPMSCFNKITLRGTFDVAVFASALEETLPYHPLLTSSVTETKGRYYWHHTGATPAIIRLPPNQPRQFPISKGIDLFREPALKVTICNDNTHAEKITGQTDIIFEVHHSASDAAGNIRFIEDVLCNYAKKRGFATPRWEAVKPDLLPFRGIRGTPGKNRVIEFYFGCFRAWTFLMNRVVSLTPKKTPDLQKLPEEYPTILCRHLTETETYTIQQKAKQFGITLNDLFLCLTFQAMKNWQNKSRNEVQRNDGKSQQKGNLRIAVPVNLRVPEDELMPAANIVSMVFLDRKPEKIQATQEFYQGVHEEIQHIKRYNLGWTFIRGLTIYRRIIGNFRRMMNPDRCWATATVTNLGRMFADIPLPRRAGRVQIDNDLELIGSEASPPVRSMTALGISVITYADCLTVNLHYDSAVLTRDDAQMILDAMLMDVQIVENSRKWFSGTLSNE